MLIEQAAFFATVHMDTITKANSINGHEIIENLRDGITNVYDMPPDKDTRDVGQAE